MATIALVTPIPSQPRPESPANDTPPECDRDVLDIAEAMRKQGVTPADLARDAHLTDTYAVPLAALIAAQAEDVPARSMPPAELARLAAPVWVKFALPVPARWRQSGDPLKAALADAVTALVPS